MTHLRQDVTDLHGNAFEVEAAMAMAFPQNYLILDYHQILELRLKVRHIGVFQHKRKVS